MGARDVFPIHRAHIIYGVTEIAQWILMIHSVSLSKALLQWLANCTIKDSAVKTTVDFHLI